MTFWVKTYTIRQMKIKVKFLKTNETHECNVQWGNEERRFGELPFRQSSASMDFMLCTLETGETAQLDLCHPENGWFVD